MTLLKGIECNGCKATLPLDQAVSAAWRIFIVFRLGADQPKLKHACSDRCFELLTKRLVDEH